jgi:hypothetical protein
MADISTKEKPAAHETELTLNIQEMGILCFLVLWSWCPYFNLGVNSIIKIQKM